MQARVEGTDVFVSFPLRNVGRGVAAIRWTEFVREGAWDLTAAWDTSGSNDLAWAELTHTSVPPGERHRSFMHFPGRASPDVAERVKAQEPFALDVFYTDYLGIQRVVTRVRLSNRSYGWMAHVEGHARTVAPSGRRTKSLLGRAWDWLYRRVVLDVQLRWGQARFWWRARRSRS